MEYSPQKRRIRDAGSLEYEILAFTRARLDEVFQIEKKLYPEPWSPQLFKESLEAPMTYGLLLSWQGACVGYAIFQVVFHEGHLLNLAIDSNYQNRGLGSAFLDVVLEESKALGASHMFLEVRPSNQPALRLYRSKGFQQLAVRPNYYADGEDALIFSTSFEK